MASLLSELRRRNVFKVGAAYAVVGWIVVEIASVVLPGFGAPDWVLKVMMLVVILGFPFAVIFAWAYELTSEGLKREKDIDRSQSITTETGQKLNYAIIGLLTLAVIILVAKDLLPGASDISEPVVSEDVDRKSIAVLPFANRSAAAENAEFFAAGIHDDLLTVLSKMGDLKVISRTSVERLNPDLSMKEIGDELGVATILEGGVQRAGDRVRINVQLVDSDTDEHLWAETYDRQLSANNIFAIQSEIAEAISTALRATLSPEEQAQITTAPTGDIDALYAYQLGKQRMEKRISTSLEEAAAFFQRAIDRDPKYALAYVGLADAHLRLTEYGGLPLDDGLSIAEQSANRALALDSRLGQAYASIATVHWKQRNLYEAERAFQKAVEFSPNYAPAWQWYGTLLAWDMGRAEEGVRMLENAVQLDPLSPIIHDNYARSMEANGRIEDGITELSRAIEIDPGFAAGYHNMGLAYAIGLGRLDEAVAWLRKAADLDPANPSTASNIGLILWDLGDKTASIEQIDHALKLGPDVSWTLEAAAIMKLHIGNETEAAVLAERAVMANKAFAAVAMRVRRDIDLKRGDTDSALQRYEAIYPELFGAEPAIDHVNYRAAIDVSLVLNAVGREDEAGELLTRSLSIIEGRPRMGNWGYELADVEIFALQGKTDEALAAFRQGVDDGLRITWRWLTVENPNMDSIKNTPEFNAIIAEIEADMAAQLAALRSSEP